MSHCLRRFGDFLVSCVNRNSVRLTNAGQEADMFINRVKVKHHMEQGTVV